MKASQRVLVNTIAQYTRTIINMLLSLYTVRVVLSSLGQSDYGIYTLIAGVVAMLGFLTNSLVQTTQRFVSYYQGNGDVMKLKEVVNNSIVIHIIFGLAIAIILELFTPLLFNGFLNIPAGREEAARIVYQIVVIILFVTFINSPYRALLISHENIIYISIVDIIDAILKLVLVIIMANSSVDKLVFYSFIMLGLQLFNILVISAYDYLKYEECVWPNFRRLKSGYVKELMAFAGWKIYGTAFTMGRDQGVSIVLNRFFGTIANAGWGIGNQISGYTNMLSSSLVTAMAPQIVKAEGRGDRNHAIWLSNILSKLVFFLMSLIGIPMIFEITGILEVWLGTPPDYASMFSIMFIFSLLFDSMTIGLTHVNNAIGNIGKYVRWMSTPKILAVPLIYILVKCEVPMVYVCATYVLIEAFCAIIRVPLIKEQAGLDIGLFLRDVIAMEIIPALLCAGACCICTSIFYFKYRFFLTFAFSAVVYAISMYYLGLTKIEKSIVGGLMNDVLGKVGLKKRMI